MFVSIGHKKHTGQILIGYLPAMWHPGWQYTVTYKETCSFPKCNEQVSLVCIYADIVN
jgi:hypothetical protein